MEMHRVGALLLCIFEKLGITRAREVHAGHNSINNLMPMQQAVCGCGVTSDHLSALPPNF